MDFYLLDHEITFEDLKNFSSSGAKMAVIANIENEQGKILLQQRGAKARDAVGLYEYIGGGIEPEDQSPKAAVMREIQEEAGEDLKLEFEKSIGICHYHPNDSNWVFAVYYFKYIKGEAKIMEPGKCMGYCFFSYEEAINSELVSSGCRYLIKNIQDYVSRKKD